MKALNLGYVCIFLEFSRNRLAAHELSGGTCGCTQFLGFRMIRLAAGSDPPDAAVVVVISLSF